MGANISLPEPNAVNYNCPKCKESGKTPNLKGRFFLINEKECQCNGCKSIYPKSDFYLSVIKE